MMVTEIVQVLDFTPYFSNYMAKLLKCKNNPIYSHEISKFSNIIH